jgi:acyl-CoA synthetase (AMP-forming)/AMP-acid ligase II
MVMKETKSYSLLKIVHYAILQHPAIAECVILGLPDNYFGEVVCAVVVLKDEAKCESNGKVGSSLTLRQLRAWAKERLAPYKVCTYFDIHVDSEWVRLLSTLFENNVLFKSTNLHTSCYQLHFSSLLPAIVLPALVLLSIALLVVV